MDQDTALMWGGIIAAILGAIILILAGVVAALSPRQQLVRREDTAETSAALACHSSPIYLRTNVRVR